MVDWAQCTKQLTNNSKRVFFKTVREGGKIEDFVSELSIVGFFVVCLFEVLVFVVVVVVVVGRLDGWLVGWFEICLS